ncbi:MAG TPA: LytR family transcriptional regulator [Firmicutes bacterium]|jgi:polyisoprenyl-teichoic acid--peptidoglycan teichoic acid transferase|nr:LytR family transcriptional regulator [Bacillota bacterium]
MKRYTLVLAVILIVLSLLVTGVDWLTEFNPFRHLEMSLLASSTPGILDNWEPFQKVLKKISDQNLIPSLTSQRFNILILGIDARDAEGSRADVIMVANVNPVLKEISLVSIPRDTRIAVAGIGYTKINHTHFLGEREGGNAKGTQATLLAVATLLHCRLNYYIKVDFQGFEDFIDSLGGLDIELPQAVKFTFRSKATLPAGKNHLNGEMTLELTRERYSLKNGDFGRQQNQLRILKSIAKQVLNSITIPQLYQFIVRERKDVVDTNLTNVDLISLAWLMRQMTERNLRYYQIRGKSEYAIDPLTKTTVYYWQPDMEDISRIQRHFR